MRSQASENESKMETMRSQLRDYSCSLHETKKHSVHQSCESIVGNEVPAASQAKATMPSPPEQSSTQPVREQSFPGMNVRSGTQSSLPLMSAETSKP